MSNLESIQIHLNSKFADKLYDNQISNAEYYLPLIEIPSQHHLLLSIQHAMIPYSFYNINSTNNTLSFQLLNIPNGTIYQTNTVYIPIGNYNSIQLASHLTQQLTIYGFSIQYQQITNKFLFTNSTYNFRFLSTPSTCNNMIGLHLTNDLLNTSILQSLTSFNQINLATQSCLCITSNFNTGSINNANHNDMNIIASIPIMNPPYSMIYYQNNSNFRINLYDNNISMINLQIKDQSGNLIDFNGIHYSITLQLDVVKFVE